MKRNVVLILILSLMLSLTPPSIALTESPVPDELPDDLGGKTLYGYLMELKSQYAPAKVFQDAAKYSDLDRENARRAVDRQRAKDSRGSQLPDHSPEGLPRLRERSVPGNAEAGSRGAALLG